MATIWEKNEPNIVEFGYSVNADEFCIIGDSLAICLSGSCIGYTSRQQISLAKKERSLESTVSKNNPSRLRVILCQPAICCSSYRSPSWAKYGGGRTILVRHRGWGARRCCWYSFHSSSLDTSCQSTAKCWEARRCHKGQSNKEACAFRTVSVRTLRLTALIDD